MTFNLRLFAVLIGVFLVVSTLPAASKDPTPKKDSSPKTPKEKLSYSIGYNIGSGFKRQEMDIDTALLMTGLKEAIAGGKSTLSEQEMQQTLQQFEQEMRTKQMLKMQESSGIHLKQGEEFLAKNKSAKGVVTLPSGLQYIELKAGNGKSPTATSTVTTHYRGTLLDGTEFDSSHKRNEPVSFPLNGVIKGWQEALPLMKEGGKMRLFVPSSLAYGDRGAPPVIPPGATLIFEIELITVK